MEELQGQIVSAVVALVGLVLSWLVAKLRQYVNARIENEYVEHVLSRLSDAVEVGVREVAATVLPDVKTAAKDGKIEVRAAELLRKRAKDAIFTQLSKMDRQKLMELFEPDQLQVKLDQLIEAAVLRRKERVA